MATKLQINSLYSLKPNRNNWGWWLLGIFLGICLLGFLYVLLERFGIISFYIFEDNRAYYFDPFIWILNQIFTFLSLLNPLFSALENIPVLSFFSGIEFTIPFEVIEGDAVRELIIMRALADAAIVTLQLSLISIFFGFWIAIFLAVVLVQPGRVWGLKWVAQAYIDFFRSTPLIVQLFLIYFGLPDLLQGMGIHFVIYEMEAAILGLSLNTAAYQAEIIRGGILAIPTGQGEAARALGMTSQQTMLHVILPQALRIIIPPFTNEGINIVLNSSLASVVSAFELTRKTQNLSSRYFIAFELYLLAAMFYFVMTFSMAKLTKRIEKRLRIPGLGMHHD